MMTRIRKYRDPPGVTKDVNCKCNGPLPILDRKLFRQSLPPQLLIPPISGKKKSCSVVVSNQGKNDRNIASQISRSSSTEEDYIDSQFDVLIYLLHKAKYPKDLNEFFKTLELTNKDGTKRAAKGMSLNLVRYLQEHAEKYAVTTSKVQSSPTSIDGSTTKLAIELHDGQVIETVIMRHEGSRNTICVSSQVGCAMQCSFCATGTMGIRGNLCHGEIVEQLVHASRYLQAEEAKRQQSLPQMEGVKEKRSKNNKNNRNNHLIRNVVFMGMGEPLNNYANVIQAAKDFISRRTWSLQYRHVTISTVGVVPNMIRLSRDLPDVGLALSLHAPFQNMRLKIVPTAKHYPIEDLMDALDNHMRSNESAVAHRSEREEEEKKDDIVQATYGETKCENFKTSTCVNKLTKKSLKNVKKCAMIEYVMLEGETSTLECAHELGRLCQHRNVVVNLIPYNPTNVKDPLKCPSMEKINEFQNIVTSYGCWCFIRRTMGQDIAGACGQLANVITEERTSLNSVLHANDTIKNQQTDRMNAVHDIEDGPFLTSGAVRLSRAPKIVVHGEKGRSKPNSRTLLNIEGDTNKTEVREFDEIESKDGGTYPTLSVSGHVPNEDQSTGEHKSSISRDLSRYVKPLAVATSLSFVCMVGSIILHLRLSNVREEQKVSRR